MPKQASFRAKCHFRNASSEISSVCVPLFRFSVPECRPHVHFMFWKERMMKHVGKSVFTSSIRSRIPKGAQNHRLRDWKVAALKRIEENIRKRRDGGEHA